MKIKKNLVLLGMMGVGKTRIGKYVARRLKINFFDIDKLIEKKNEMKITEIFKIRGEIYFRNEEEFVTIKYLNKKGSIISLGGGGFINNKIRKKVLPTFGEQHEAAIKAGKKEFTSVRDTEKGGGLFSGPKGKLHYAATKKEDVAKKIAKSKAAALKAKEGKGGGADSGSKKKPVYEKATGTKVSERGQAFAAARKAGKDTYMYKGKKYTTLMKGEKKKKPLISGKGIFGKKINIPKIELSGGTAKKIKTFVSGKKKEAVNGKKKIKTGVGAQAGGRIADAARRAQSHGFYSPDMGMEGAGPGPNVTGRGDPRMGMRGPGMPGPNVTGGRRGFAKGGLIKGKPKLAVKGW